MIVPSNRSAAESDSAVEDEIALEPTRSAGFDSASSGTGDWGATSTSFATSFVNDTAKLLRSRLFAVALFYGSIIAVRYVFSLLVPDTGEGLAGSSLAARALFSFAVAGLLGSRQVFSLKQLRAIEYLFFGLHALAILVTQYLISSELIMRGDAVGVVAFDKNGVIRILVLMLLYGVVIPNDPKITARVVLTMAIGPSVILALLTQVHSATGTIMGQMVAGEMAASNAVFVVLGAGVAIFAAYAVNGLRKDLHDAKRLGQYELGHKLGGGGMGEVYLAEHQLLKRPCAVKLINADHQSNPVTVARFQREVQSAAKLTHPNTIEIFDYGHTDDGTFYCVMEYLPGMNLADLVEQFGPLNPGRAIYIMRQVCKSLAEAHCHGMVHRDLKPANIFLAILGGECDVAKVLDFGLVKLPTSPDSPQLTTDFTVSGTPWFMSPEQATGARNIDGRADIYSLGAVLYFALTGKPPFEKETPAAVMVAHASEPVRPPSQMGSDVPGDLEALVLKCLAKAPADRFTCAREVAVALDSCQCAADWDDSRAEHWWLEQADKHASGEATTCVPP